MNQTTNIIRHVARLLDGTLTESSKPASFPLGDMKIEVSKINNLQEGAVLLSKHFTMLDEDTLYVDSNTLDQKNMSGLIQQEISSFVNNMKAIKSDAELKVSTNIDDFVDTLLFLCVDVSNEVATKKISSYIGTKNNPSEYVLFSDRENDPITWKNRVNELTARYIHGKYSSLKECVELPARGILLDEGMIKIPQKPYDYVNHIIDYVVYNNLRSIIFEESSKRLVESFIPNLGYDIDKLKDISKEVSKIKTLRYDKIHGIVGSISMKITKADIPYNIEFDPFVLTISFTNNTKDVHGFMDTSRGKPIVGINFGSLQKYMVQLHDKPDLLNDSVFAEGLEYIIKNIRTTVTHELMHVVQVMVIHNVDKNQKTIHRDTTNFKSASEREQYYLRPIEFDPAINDVVGEFNAKMDSLRSHFVDVSDEAEKELLKKYLAVKYKEGEVPKEFRDNPFMDAIESTFTPPTFIDTLKDHDKKRWKIAIKKIYSEIFK